MELTNGIVILNIGATIGTVAYLGYLWGKHKELEIMLYSMKDPEEVIEKAMKTKVPILMGPDGRPMVMPGLQPPQQATNPITG